MSENKIKISHDDYMSRKMEAVKAYIAVAHSCRPAALHAALLTIFEVTDAPAVQWAEMDLDAFRELVASAPDDDAFRKALKDLPPPPETHTQEA